MVSSSSTQVGISRSPCPPSLPSFLSLSVGFLFCARLRFVPSSSSSNSSSSNINQPAQGYRSLVRSYTYGVRDTVISYFAQSFVSSSGLQRGFSSPSCLKKISFYCRLFQYQAYPSLFRCRPSKLQPAHRVRGNSLSLELHDYMLDKMAQVETFR
ncbi:hypothetical protein K445DRAFT_149043 [Daldinia sp. EC12]|nr:hypothetical protein K445DRAFT_149043 [Daldinia sp. EC12]